jgi:hypothetical protein
MKRLFNTHVDRLVVWADCRDLFGPKAEECEANNRRPSLQTHPIVLQMTSVEPMIDAWIYYGQPC